MSSRCHKYFEEKILDTMKILWKFLLLRTENDTQLNHTWRYHGCFSEIKFVLNLKIGILFEFATCYCCSLGTNNTRISEEIRICHWHPLHPPLYLSSASSPLSQSNCLFSVCFLFFTIVLNEHHYSPTTGFTRIVLVFSSGW